MKLTVTKTITRTISRCAWECPFFSDDGHEASCGHPVMVEDVKRTGDAYLDMISFTEAREGFPKNCPLLKDKKQ